MLKKIILSLTCLMLVPLSANADDLSDVKTFFDKYVNAANSYEKNIPDYYTSNAKIIRVVYKKDGTTQSVVIPFDRYLSEMKKGEALAKATRYKNTYTDKKYTKVGADYKVSAIRIPRNDKSGLPAHFIVTKTPNGWKIKEELMGTTVQKFLDEK